MAEQDLPRTAGKVLQKMEDGLSGLRGGRDPVRIISHYDADGLCAAGILSRAFLRMNRPFHTTIAHQIDGALVDLLSKQSYPWVIFSDMGSGALDLVEKLESSVIILDHHQPLRESRKAVQLNCHLWGIDGTFECCASTLALMAAVALDEANWDLSGVACAGAIGDRQHQPAWKGLNAEIMAFSEKAGHLRTRKGLVLEGTDLGSALSQNNEPFFRGVSGNPEGARALIEAAGLSAAATLKELDEAEVSALSSLLVLSLLRGGASEEFARAVMVDRHWVTGYDTDANELSAVVNACGRLGQEDLGLSVCLGGRQALVEARAVREQYRGLMTKGMLELEAKGMTRKANIQYFYSDNAQMAGAFAALVMNYLFPGKLPTISLAREGQSIKVSARGTRPLVAKGLDLAKACRLAASRSGGDGGGHSIASGATVPLGSEMAFLDALDAAVGEQLAGGGK
jgi:single-stranded-DNA-specific exonuclease